jgi:insulysin
MIKINKPKFDNKNIIGGLLDNNIKYILINDKNLDKSYISVSINIGSYNNPKNYDGLAHFLEHMLFLGSKKYPQINYFSDKLNIFGGSSNAYTDNLETVYYFNVHTSGLKEIIDIFSRFFIDPLFDKNSIKKEINAINNEYLKNINNDNWKLYQFINNIYNSDSLIKNFSTGSIESLDKSDLLEEMLKFYNNNYISSNISLCIGSSLSIEELYNIINKSFGKIVKKDKNKFIINKPFLSDNMNKTFYLKSIADIYNISYIWEIPIIEEYLYTKDFNILSLLICDISNNNFYFHLINKGYINNINIDILYEGLFIIKISLSQLGYNNIEYIDNILFNYLDFIYKLDLNKYAIYYNKINNIIFYNLYKYNIGSLCNLLSTNLHYYKIKDVYSCIYLIFKIKSTEEYKTIYKKYINKNNFIKIIQSNNIKTNLFSKFYNNKYRKIDNIFKYIKIPSNIINNFNIDLNNLLLNIKSKIIKNLDIYEIPQLINKNQWFGAVSKYNEPLVYIWIKLYNNNLFINPENYILTSLSCKIINFLIRIYINKSFDIFNCNISFNPNLNSLYLFISSLNDINKLKIFIKNIYNFLLNIKKYLKILSNIYIDNLIEEFKLDLHNIKFCNPWEYNDYIFNSTINTCEYNNKLLLKNISKINNKKIIKYIINLDILNISNITSLLYGNISNKNNNLLDIFHNNNNNNHKYIYNDILLFNNINLNHPNKKEQSNCVTYYYYIGSFIPLNYLLLNLTIHILNEWFYNELRTKYQLGYLVSMDYIKIKDYYFIIQKIQSTKSIDFIELKIKNFNNNILNKINKLDITNYIQSIKNNLLEKYYTINQTINTFIVEINYDKYFFNRKDILLKYIDKINKNNLIKFIKTFIIDNKCFKIIIKGN